MHSLSRPNKNRTTAALRTLHFLASLGLGGCGLQSFTDPVANPIIQDDVRLDNVPYDITSLTPVRRVIVFGNNSHGGNPEYCAESPTDAGENISTTATASLAASLPTGTQVGAEAARALATALQVLNKKTQGIIFYEKESYRLCEALMNKRISPDQYFQLLSKLHEDTVRLIDKEIERGFQQADFQGQQPVILTLDESDRQRLIDRILPPTTPDSPASEAEEENPQAEADSQ